MRLVDRVAGSTLWLLLAAISPLPALAQDSGEEPERSTARARDADYTVSKGTSDQELKCLYRNEIKLLCPDAEFIAFEKHYRVKDYDLIVISMGYLGSGTRWWDWKLIVEDGTRSVIKPLADACLECDIQVDRLNFRSNEVVFTYRQKQYLKVGTFRAGQLAIQRSKLDPHEPLDEQTCEALFQDLEECKSTKPSSLNCTMMGSTATNFLVRRTEDHYAGISSEHLERQCKVACSTGKAMDRTNFFRNICRRKTG
jgi:hypothetical protein